MYQKKHPRLASLLLHLPSVPRTYPSFLEHHSAEGAVICRWGDHRMEAGGRKPSLGDIQWPGDLQTCSSPDAPPILGWGRLGFSAGGPASGGGCSCGGQEALQVHCGVNFLPQDSSARWDPPVLGQKPAHSPRMWHHPGHHGLRAIESAPFWFLFLYFYSLIWIGICS